jgi:hypothetical protein
MTINEISASEHLGVRLAAPGGGINVMLGTTALTQYRADPDGFAAEYFELTLNEYAEWIATEGAPRCEAHTASGELCKNLTGGYQLEAAEWKTLHRKLSCVSHS